jgi:hypothetical protein
MINDVCFTIVKCIYLLLLCTSIFIKIIQYFFCKLIMSYEYAFLELTDDIKLPSWLPGLEYAILAMISMITLMTAGCICLKCCLVCGCMTSDKERKEKQRNTTDSFQPESYSLKPKSLIDF